MLRAVDIASHQAGIDPAALDCDIVIVKATGGTSYENPYWRAWVDSAMASGKLVAIYHYAMEYGAYNDASAEARFFLDAVADYKGRFVPILDFEADAQGLPVEWPLAWLDMVAEETGATPFFYAYASYLNSRDHSMLTRYPLWMASYLNRYIGAGWVDDPDNTWATGSWEHMSMYQYTSTGRIGGWGGGLDLSVFYGGREDWMRLQGGGSMMKEKMVQLAVDVAEDDSHGYSQANRWPWQGSDFDCSSLMYWSAHEAGYNVPLSGYTGTMYNDFTSAGFTAHPYGSVGLQRGDILLAHNSNRQHTEMYIGDGQTAGAHSSETGGIYGQPGDQTGNEISIAPNYGGWDWVLRPPESEDDMGIYDVHKSAAAEIGGSEGSMIDHVDWLEARVKRMAEPHESATGDGTVGSMSDRIDYIDKRVREGEGKMDAIGAELREIKALLKKAVK